MTNKQKIFCDEYLIDFNATRAYMFAYPACKKEKTAAAASSRMLRNVNIQAYIQEATKEKQERSKITQNDIVNQLAKIAFGDIRKLYTDTGAIKNVKDFDDDTVAAITSIETYQEFDGNGNDKEYIGDTKKVKMTDKVRALELLGKHLGMFTEKIKIEQEKPFEVKITVKKK